MMVRLAEAVLWTSPAPPGTKACDAAGGAFRPEWREGPVSGWERASSFVRGDWGTDQ